MPHPGKQDMRIAWVHGQVRAARFLVHKQHPLPTFSAIGGAEDPAFGLRTVSVSQCTGQHDFRMVGIDDDVSNAPRFLQPHGCPGLPRIERAVNSTPNRYVAPDERFSGACPNHIRVAPRHRQRSNRRHRLCIENRLPVDAAIGGFEDSARRRSHVIKVRLARHSGDRGSAIPDWPDVAKLQLAVNLRIRRRLLGPNKWGGAKQ